MTSKEALKKLKITLKRETSRIINTLPLTDAQSKILREESHKIIEDGNDEKTILKNLRRHAELNHYEPYKSTSPKTKEKEIETEKEKQKKQKEKEVEKEPPAADTSSYKDVKKYTKDVIRARLKNREIEKGTPLARERIMRRKTLLEKSRALPENLSKEGKLLIDYLTKRIIIIDEESRIINQLKDLQYEEVTPVELLGKLEEKDFLDEDYYETLTKYRELVKYLKEQKNEFADKFLSYIDYQSYAVQTHKQEIDHMFDEFLTERESIRKEDLERERRENEEKRTRRKSKASQKREKA